VIAFATIHILLVVSQNDTDDEQSGSSGQLRTVGSYAGLHPNREMNLIGSLIFAGLLILALPLLPILVVGWVLLKVVGRYTSE
jgi:hypothetical protein